MFSSPALLLSKSVDKPLDKNMLQERIEEERDIQKKLKEIIWLCPPSRKETVVKETAIDSEASLPSQESPLNPSVKIPLELEGLLRLAPSDIPPRLQDRLLIEFEKFKSALK